MCLLSRRWETWPCGHHREDEPELEEICRARRNGDVAGCNRCIRWTDEASPIILPSRERCPECGGECDNHTNVSDAILFFRDRDAVARRVYESRRRQQRQSPGGDAQYGGCPQVGGRPNQHFNTAESFLDSLRRSARSQPTRGNGSPSLGASPKLPLALQEAIRRFRRQRPGQNRPILIDRNLAPGVGGDGIASSPRTPLSSGMHHNSNHFGLGNHLGRSKTPMPIGGHGFQLPVASSIPLDGLFGDFHGPGNMRGGTMPAAYHTAPPGPEAGGSNNPFDGLLREIRDSRNSSTGIGDMELPVRTSAQPLTDIGLGGGQTAFPVHELQDPVILSPTEGIARVPGGLVVFNPSIVGYPPGARDGSGLYGYTGEALEWP
ncbi:hypothetical protein MCOR25_006726 [Pyricularia grisea]|nr:hypothetical protein MCOR25_006726 [Pyricularia grisea]